MAGSMLSFHVMMLLLAFLAIETVFATCWFPDGVTPDPDGYPCNASASASQCCRTFEACLTGGVCYTQFDSQMYRRSCTDQTFTDTNCPQECKNVFPSGGEGLLECTDGPHPTYCCDIPNSSTSCCNNGSFGFIPGAVMGVLDGAGVLNTPSAATVTTASFTSTSSSLTSTSSATSTTSSTTATQTSSASPAPAPSHTGRTVGLAVGIPLGVCAIAAVLGIWYMFRRKLDRARKQREILESRINIAGAASKKPELSTEKLGPNVGPEAQEMDISRRQELDTTGDAPHEAGNMTYRHEVM